VPGSKSQSNGQKICRYRTVHTYRRRKNIKIFWNVLTFETRSMTTLGPCPSPWSTIRVSRPQYGSYHTPAPVDEQRAQI
jgi:hypothetical protein